MRKWIIVSVIFVAGIGGFTAYKMLNHQEPVLAQIATAEVTRGNIEVKVSGTGVLEPVTKESVKAAEEGTVVSIEVEEGAEVKKGDILVTYEAEDLSDQIQQAQTNLKKKRLELQDLQERQKEIIENEKVTAPEKGYLISLNVEEGDEVSANEVIGSIRDSDTKKVTVPFPSHQMQHIKPGQKAEVFIVSNFYSLEGTVSEVDLIGETQSNGSTYHDVTIEFQEKIAAGSAAQITVNTPNGNFTGLKNGLVSESDTIEIRTKISGEVTNLYVNEQEKVEEGQAILELESDQSVDINIEQTELDIQEIEQDIASYQEDQIPPSPTRSPIDGVVLSIDVALMDEVKLGRAIAEIINYEDLQLVVPVDELDIPKIVIGQSAEIIVDAFPEETFRGEVSEIAREGTSQNGVSTFDVKILMERNDKLRSGMSASAEIMIEGKEDVLMVPIEAVQQRNGQSFVRVMNSSSSETENNLQEQGEMKAVQTGIHNETFMEIINGLEAGEKVVIPSVIRQQSNQAPNFGGGMRTPGGFGGGTGRPSGGFGGGGR